MLRAHSADSARKVQLDWRSSLRGASWRNANENTEDSKNGHNFGDGERILQPETNTVIDDENRKSPMSQTFHDFVGSFRDKWLLPQNCTFRMQALASESEKLSMREKESSRFEGSFSRQLDFDSENISFETSPLKIDTASQFNVVSDLLKHAKSLDMIPFSSRAMVAHQVRVFSCIIPCL
jgi:hypothetical protein